MIMFLIILFLGILLVCIGFQLLFKCYEIHNTFYYYCGVIGSFGLACIGAWLLFFSLGVMLAIVSGT